MTFAADVAADTANTHDDWKRADITRRRRTLTGVSLTGSTPTFTTATATITGVLTVVDSSLQLKVFGGLVAGDAILEVLPAVDIQYEDEIICDGVAYRVDEIRAEDVNGVCVQRYCRLVRVKP